jgi:hypothetical protein
MKMDILLSCSSLNRGPLLNYIPAETSAKFIQQIFFWHTKCKLAAENIESSLVPPLYAGTRTYKF